MAGIALMAFNLVAADAAKIKVLLVTGDDVGAHPWREVSQATRDLLVASGKFEVKICEDAAILESAAALKRYDVVYMGMYNNSTPTLSDTAKQNLADYVKGGKGFVVSHLSSASFKEWGEFKNLCGRNWVMGKSGHGPRAPFQCKVVDQEHAITKGLKNFEADDELYAKMQGDAPIKVLVTADSDWSKQTEPLAFVIEYGQGRVFHHTFGHDGKALKSQDVQTLIARDTQWAAKGKVE
jgi:uncharacterized protein